MKNILSTKKAKIIFFSIIGVILVGIIAIYSFYNLNTIKAKNDETIEQKLSGTFKVTEFIRNTKEMPGNYKPENTEIKNDAPYFIISTDTFSKFVNYFENDYNENSAENIDFELEKQVNPKVSALTTNLSTKVKSSLKKLTPEFFAVTDGPEDTKKLLTMGDKPLCSDESELAKFKEAYVLYIDEIDSKNEPKYTGEFATVFYLDGNIYVNNKASLYKVEKIKSKPAKKINDEILSNLMGTYSRTEFMYPVEVDENIPKKLLWNPPTDNPDGVSTPSPVLAPNTKIDENIACLKLQDNLFESAFASQDLFFLGATHFPTEGDNIAYKTLQMPKYTFKKLTPSLYDDKNNNIQQVLSNNGTGLCPTKNDLSNFKNAYVLFVEDSDSNFPKKSKGSISTIFYLDGNVYTTYNNGLYKIENSKKRT